LNSSEPAEGELAVVPDWAVRNTVESRLAYINDTSRLSLIGGGALRLQKGSLKTGTAQSEPNKLTPDAILTVQF